CWDAAVKTPKWIANAIYYPTLGYNVVLGRILKVRRWWDPVTDWVVLGARPLPGDLKAFKDMGITGVVNTCEEMAGPVKQYETLGIEQLWIPTTDFTHPAAADVEAGAEFIERHRQQQGKVYVHCKAGRARSATVVLWWLVKYCELSPEKAQQTILEARPHANPRVYQRPVIRKLHDGLKKSSEVAENAD
ncbi:MAG: dual specificity protein phosphatase family protein, partial [Planctomycetota bacterium]